MGPFIYVLIYKEKKKLKSFEKYYTWDLMAVRKLLNTLWSWKVFPYLT